MRKILLSAATCCCVLLLGGCSDDKQAAKPRAGRIAFDAPALAAKLNTDFETFRLENEKNYAGRSATGSLLLNGYLKAGGDSILLRIRVEREDNGKIGSIHATAEDPANDLALWKHYITHAESFHLGQFLGTKFRSPASSGVHQTIDSTIDFIATNGTAGIESHTIFSVMPGSAYAVAVLSEGAFTAMLTNSYLALDYPKMRSWLGGDHAALATKYYIQSNKLNLWGNIYINFSSAKDTEGKAFYVDVHADKQGAKVTEIDVYADPEKNTKEELLAIWRDYAANAASYRLGTFHEAYTTDSFGEKKESFDSLAEAISHVDEKGRPGAFDGGIIVVFEADGIATNLVMNASYIYLLMKDPNYNVE